MARNTTLKENTINCLLETSFEKFGPRPALGMALEKPLTYSDVFRSVCSMAAMLKKLGVLKGDKIAILGENSPNWGIACLAAMRVGAVVVPILPDFPETDIHHILADSEAKILFTTQRQMEKVLGLRDHKLLTAITLDDFTAETDFLTVEPISNFIEKARNFLRQIPDKIGLKLAAVNEDDIASIIYTSGTSGHSKAVMLSHKNFISNVLTTSNHLLEVFPETTFLSILPLSHTYEFTLGFLFPMSARRRPPACSKRSARWKNRTSSRPCR
jgi:long-chain acyl-CoA synthetase